MVSCIVQFCLEVKDGDGPYYGISFYPVNAKFSIPDALLMITCGITWQAQIQKSPFQEEDVHKAKVQ
jgi:hypothetical protein